MKRIVRVCGVAVLFFLILVGTKFFCEHWFSLRNEGLEGELHQKEVDLLFVGSSHTRQGYDIQKVEAETGLEAYAVAYDGLDYYYMLPLLETLLHDPRRRPKLCILEAYTANLARAPELEDPRLFFDAPPGMKRKILSAYLRTNAGLRGWQNLFVLVVNRGTDQILSYPLVRSMVDTHFYRGGYIRKQVPGIMPSRFSQMRVPVAGSLPNPLQVESLEKILALTAKVRVPVILVDPPLPASVARQPEVLSLKEWFRKFAREHDIPFVDGDEGFPIADPAMFADSNHVSTEGRELYTDQLALRLLSANILPETNSSQNEVRTSVGK